VQFYFAFIADVRTA